MRITLIILAIICALLGLALSILPFGSIAFIPIVIGFLISLYLLKMNKNHGQNSVVLKIIFTLIIIALGLTIYRSLFDKNVVEENIESVEKDKQSEEDAIKELDGVEIDD